MPTITEDLHGDTLYGAAFAAFMLANLVGIVVAGEQADRRGPVASFLVGVVGFGAGLLVAGLAPSMPVLILGRVLQGAGAGGLAATSYVAIGRGFAPERQPKLFALLSAGWVLPSLVAPAAAGVVSDHWGWRWVFLGLLPLVAVLMVLALPALVRLGPPPGIDGQAPRPSRGRWPWCWPLGPGSSSPVSAPAPCSSRCRWWPPGWPLACPRCAASYRRARPGPRPARPPPSPAGSWSTSHSSARTSSCPSPRHASTGLPARRRASSSSAARWRGRAGRRCRPAGRPEPAARVVAAGFALVAARAGRGGSRRVGRLPALGRVPALVPGRLRHRRCLQHHVGGGAVMGAERARKAW